MESSTTVATLHFINDVKTVFVSYVYVYVFVSPYCLEYMSRLVYLYAFNVAFSSHIVSIHVFLYHHYYSFVLTTLSPLLLCIYCVSTFPICTWKRFVIICFGCFLLASLYLFYEYLYIILSWTVTSILIQYSSILILAFNTKCFIFDGKIFPFHFHSRKPSNFIRTSFNIHEYLKFSWKVPSILSVFSCFIFIILSWFFFQFCS